MKQSQRTSVMKDFKSGRTRLLIATDVAARGIDVEDVDAVFNYDVPQELEYYVHRIGRTGRAGREGASYTLVSGKLQLTQLRKIEQYIHGQIEERPVPTVASIRKQKETEFRDVLREAASEGIDEKWLSFVASLEQEGFSAREVAAILCERMQKKNRRTASLQDVSVRPVPRHADKYSSSHIRGQKYKSRFRSESREKERRNSRRHTADYKRKKSGSRS